MKKLICLLTLMSTSAFAATSTYQCNLVATNEIVAVNHKVYGAPQAQFTMKENSKFYVKLQNSYGVDLGAQIYFNVNGKSHDLDIFITDQLTDVQRLQESGNYENIRKANDMTIGNLRASFTKGNSFSFLIRDNKYSSMENVDGIQESIYALNCEKK